jgi:hypothetical protein
MSSSTDPGSASPPLRGEVVYFYAFDLAYDMQRAPLPSLLGRALEPFQVDARKRVPRGQVFYRPLVARLPALEQIVRGKSVSLEVAVKVLPIGALSVTVRAPLLAHSPAECTAWHDLAFDDGTSLGQWVLATVEKARVELAAHAIRPHERLPEAESYTVFCLDAASLDIAGESASWLENNRGAVAGLLTGEEDASLLSTQEITESTSRWLSYYRHDLIVADWDAALVIDRPEDFDETLYVMELANVQLEELEAYDAFIDDALERAYRDLGTRRRERRRHVLHDLQELRMDLARFSDELSNITKFFGEWHLARVYETVARVFHLGDWHRAIDEKLRTLDSLYDTLKQDQNHRVMVWLEAAIVVMFIIDLVLIFMGMAK